MSTAVLRVSPGELSAWGREDPDLEIDDGGRIHPIAPSEPAPARGPGIGSVAPAALSVLLRSVPTWD